MAGDAVVLITLRGAGHISSAVIHGQPALAGHGLMNGSGWRFDGPGAMAARPVPFC